ncbi:type II toxin-antitoxin system RelE/ParE family toxin [Sphaerochaeta associata]|uniref:type II toxin-antitoxin system RelE/ParE family toxin n=1 Tax=Sphaerochaeta associata TaxID=1129264 RepID=UPI003B000722
MQINNVLRGTGGLRKYRVAFPGRGKSGSGRVAYVDFTVHGTIYLITAYPKSQKDNLSTEERKEIAKVIAILEKGLQKQEIRK